MSFEENILECIKSIDWANFKGPEYYNPQKVIESLSKLTVLIDEKTGRDASNSVLFAIGNNHAGTYYPAIEKALGIIIEIAISSNYEISRYYSLDMLIDIYSGFESDVGTNKILLALN